MNREEYLKRLEELLYDISIEERLEALQYYMEYFQDADLDDAEIIKELGSPDVVAASIKAEISEKAIVKAEDVKFNETDKNQGDKKEKNAWMIAGIVVACIFGLPVILSVGGTIVGVLFGVFAALFGLVIASAGCGLGFGIAAIACIIVAIVKLFVSPIASVILIGVGLMSLGLCFLFVIATWKLCDTVVVGVFKGIAYLVKLPFQKKEVTAS